MVHLFLCPAFKSVLCSLFLTNLKPIQNSVHSTELRTKFLTPTCPNSSPMVVKNILPRTKRRLPRSPAQNRVFIAISLTKSVPFLRNCFVRLPVTSNLPSSKKEKRLLHFLGNSLVTSAKFFLQQQRPQICQLLTDPPNAGYLRPPSYQLFYFNFLLEPVHRI